MIATLYRCVDRGCNTFMLEKQIQLESKHHIFSFHQGDVGK